MQIIIPIFFITIALIQIGILINSLSFIKIYPKENALKFWAASLTCNSIGCILIAIGLSIVTNLAKGSVFLTVANTIYFASAVLLVLYSRAINKTLINADIKISLATMILYIVCFELVRFYGGFMERQIFTALSLFIVYFFMLIENIQQKIYRNSKYLKIFLVTTILEFIFLILRIILILPNNYEAVNNLNQVPVSPLVTLWLMLIVNVWSYTAINGFWTEKTASSNTKNIIENTKIKKLLDEKYKLLNSLIIANKTAVSGALSASIAHEINQPLGAIKINSQHLNMLVKDKKSKLIVDRIIKDNDKAAGIISTLRNIFTNKKNIYQSIEFDRFIEEQRPLLESVCEKNKIDVLFTLKSFAVVNINTDEIRQVIFNLAHNSIEAFSLISKRKKIISIKTYKKNKTLILAISDNGPGIHPKFKKNIFNLYESSKPKNIGLGLWLCKYIITKHHGKIFLNNENLKATEFIIELPIVKDA